MKLSSTQSNPTSGCETPYQNISIHYFYCQYLDSYQDTVILLLEEEICITE